MLGNGFVFIFSDITFVSVYSFSDGISSFSCPKAIYIGETGNTIRKQINGHKSDIRKNKNKPVAKHFNLPEHSASHLQVSILKRTNANRRQRQIEEQKLMSKFNCIQEGLNKDSGFLSHYLKKTIIGFLLLLPYVTFSSLTSSSISYLFTFLLMFLTYVSPFSVFSFSFSYFFYQLRSLLNWFVMSQCIYFMFKLLP